ncbi:hypothetical protein PTSG_11871 [Salpingoeca rosetta]|uniref:Uncharacterized protein n=1 Tax=Salpingoeca rosetta (strain ATCC 50818 / BSB-021) TaxID=946362 RepID=F2U1W4_SALR5|nr:uncharacterized protein PTSG_11871 [Salpingoeca rosetta]EGD81616.1 hypothetical protein PTSG_11871 [Salpingoeca rosetta]|eukprot:XP_004996820.1 hypothetical protein PTSG_11871 [Salpingoeca rosetta]
MATRYRARPKKTGIPAVVKLPSIHKSPSSSTPGSASDCKAATYPSAGSSSSSTSSSSSSGRKKKGHRKHTVPKADSHQHRQDDVSEDAVEEDLELVKAMQEQLALQRQLLQYEYELEQQQDAANDAQSGIDLQQAYEETRKAIRTARGGRRKKATGGSSSRQVNDDDDDDAHITHPSGPL